MAEVFALQDWKSPYETCMHIVMTYLTEYHCSMKKTLLRGLDASAARSSPSPQERLHAFQNMKKEAFPPSVKSKTTLANLCLYVFIQQLLCAIATSRDNLSFILAYFLSGADPERNLTRAQPKSRGCGYMGVAISMGSYRHDLANAPQLSA